MKKLILILALFTLLSKNSAGQAERLAFDTKDFIQSGFYNLNAMPDDEGNVIVLYKQKTLDTPPKFFTNLIFNPSDHSEKQMKLFGDRHFIGYAHENGVFTIAFKDDLAMRSEKEQYQLLQVTKNGETIKNSQIDLGSEKVLSSFSYRGLFYIMSVDRSENLINLRSVSSGSEIKLSSVKIDKAMRKELEDIDAQFIHSDFEISNRQLKGAKIVPVAQNIFQLSTRANIIDKKGSYIHSMIIDFNRLEYSITSLEIEDKSSSYFIVNDTLYLLSTNLSKINLHVYSISQSIKIASHTFNRDSSESVAFDGPFFLNGEEEVFKNKKQKIRSVFSKDLNFINVSHQNKLIRVTIGSRFLPLKYTPAFNTSTGMITTGPVVTSYDESDAEYFHFYIYLDKNLALVPSYPDIKSPQDIVEKFVIKIRQENKKLISDYWVINTQKRTLLITNSNRNKLIKCFEWINY